METNVIQGSSPAMNVSNFLLNSNPLLQLVKNHISEFLLFIEHKSGIKIPIITVMHVFITEPRRFGFYAKAIRTVVGFRRNPDMGFQHFIESLFFQSFS